MSRTERRKLEERVLATVEKVLQMNRAERRRSVLGRTPRGFLEAIRTECLNGTYVSSRDEVMRKAGRDGFISSDA